MKPRFHYTKALYLSSICKDRAIKPATLYVPTHEKSVVWCSTRSDYEPTARPGKPFMDGDAPYSVEEMTELPFINPVRIEVDSTACPYNWGAFVRLSGVKKKMARNLEQVARLEGARSEDWYASFEPIGAEHWKVIAYYFDQTWRGLAVNDQVLERLAQLSVDELRSAVATGILEGAGRAFI